MTSTTKVLAGPVDVCHSMESFCTEHFGPGGVQKGRRWFYRIVTPVTIEVYKDRTWGDMNRHLRRRNGDDQTMVYFRDSADAVWFNLKFKSE